MIGHLLMSEVTKAKLEDVRDALDRKVRARSAELEALTAADCDGQHMQIMIARQADREDRAKDKKTKTRIGRPIELEPALAPLVELLVKERPDGRLLPNGSPALEAGGDAVTGKGRIA